MRWHIHACLILAFIGAELIIPINVSAGANPNCTDNFDSYTAGLLPGANHDGVGPCYTYSDAGDSSCRVTTAQSSSTPNSILIDHDNTGCNSSNGLFTFLDSVCNNPDAFVTFKFRMSGTLGANFYISSTTHPSFEMAVDSAGNVFAATTQNTGTRTAGNAIPGVTLVLNTWYTATMAGFRCDSTGYFYVFVGGGASQVTNPTASAGGNTLKGITSTSGQKLYVDDLSITGFKWTYSTADNIVCKQGDTCGNTVTGWTGDLNGFDVDPFTNIVIARTKDGATSTDSIRAFNPLSLSQIGASPVHSGCNYRADGVMAYTEINNQASGRFFTAFADCTSSSASVNRLSIRGGDLNSPDQSGTVCTDFCDFDLETQSNSIASENCATSAAGSNNQLSGQTSQIGNIAAVPISWKQGFNPSGLVAKNVYVGFAYSTITSGNVGFWVIKQVNQNPDFSCGYELPFVPGGTTIAQICTMHYTNMTAPSSNDFSGDFIIAGGNNAAGRIWQMSVHNLFTTSGEAQPPILNMEAVGPTLRPNLKAVGCMNSNDVITQGSDSTIQRMHIFPGLDYTTPTYINGKPHYSHTAVVGTAAWSGIPGYSTGINRALAVSQEGNWFAYLKDATTAIVANATNGKTLAYVTMPSGTFESMKLGRNGQTLYIATTTTIARFDIHATTTITALSPNCNADGSCVDSQGNPITPGTTTQPGITSGGIVAGILTPFLGDLGSMGELILGLIILGIFGLGGFIIGNKSKGAGGWGCLMGCAVGYVIAIPTANFPPWPAIVAVVVAVAFIVMRARG